MTSGEYSDCTPEAVFSTRESAEAAITKDHQTHSGVFSYNDEIDGIELDPED